MRLDDPSWLRDQAQRCSRLAATTTDQRTATTLKLMAAEYEQQAVTLETSIVAEVIPDTEPPPEPAT